jgi:uncharacterized delta-60 repeat protein
MSKHTLSRGARTAFVALLLLTTLTGLARAAPGDLDSSFGTGGLVTTDFGGRGDFGLAVAVQPDGKIVTAGNSSAVGVFSVFFALSRHNTNGTLDTTFGSGGTVLTSFGGSLAAAADVVVQSDGKIVAVGLANGDFGVARYNNDGTLDTTFGSGGGLVTTDFGGFDQANGVSLQADGKIVAVGLLGNAVGLARYNSNGSLDPTFGTGGKVITDATATPDGGYDVAVTSNGKIVVGGGTSFGASDFLVIRYNSDGSLDSSFGGSGIVTTDFGGSDSAFAIALTADGKVTAAGERREAGPGSAGDFALARYNSDGSVDSSFGSGGKVTTDFSSGSSDTGEGVVIQSDGSITVAGITTTASGTAFGVVRYTATGALDNAFGSGGKASASFGNPVNNAFDIAAQPDGKVVVAGGTGNFTPGGTDFALARFLGTPTAITVSIDVKPGSTDNVIPLQSNGVISVAILTTGAFDAASVDPASVCFGSANDPSRRDCTEKHGTGHLEDVNGDGRSDLLLHYETQETGIRPGDTQACLTGKTYSGTSIQGCDQIVTQ